jgi:dihydroflavonol-4-reductase
MTTYFITGGFGFLGQYIVQAIHDYDPQGELRVLVRSQRRTFLKLEKLDRVKWVRGELTQPESFAEYLKGVDTVIHSAAIISFTQANAQKVFDSNVVGTQNLAQAAREAGCKNFIFISSISAIEFRPPQITDETMIPDLEAKRQNDVYGYTKLMSEMELKKMSNDMRVIILNPSVILGPGVEFAGAIVNAIRKLPILPMIDYINAFVDVRDVARAVTFALTKGRSGERYIVSSYNIRMTEFTRAIVKQLGKTTRVFALSPFGLRLVDALVSFLDTLHLNSSIRRPSQMSIDKPCSYEKIKCEMGWEPTYSLEQSIADSASGGGA